MMNMNLLNRSGLAAIAAATAFIATPVLAQDATPVAAEPAPIVADAPLPSDPAPTPTPEVTSEPAAPAPVATKSVRAAKPAARTVRTAVAAPTIVRTAAPVAATAPVIAPTPPVEAAADPAMVAPIPEPAAPAPVAPVATTSNDDMLPIAGAAGLGVLALAGAGFAMRRRRRDDDVIAEDEWVEPEAATAQPLPIAPVATAPISAFAWSDTPAAAVPVAAPSGLSRIEAAKRGPTADNPSASLKKRLSRAAFFDQRERAVAAGTAVPVSPMAGLPKSLARVEAPTRRAAPTLGMGLNRGFQPA